MAKIEEVEGIGPANAEKLAAAGITTTDDLLQRAPSRAGRQSLETSTGISGKRSSSSGSTTST